ncbi:MAG: ribosome recycling factor [Gammaproteobacteria bacterium]|nr:ribosome recycling factor [Gammaproteobacteria bacterium]
MTETKDIQQHAEASMKKCIESLHNSLGKLRTGRASPGLLDPVRVPYFGNDVPLSQVATVAVADARTLTVTPWEKNLMAPIEKAISVANLGLNPSSVGGHTIRIPLPALTQERRKELIKILKGEVEAAKVSLRNIRRDANGQLKNLLKDKTISEDEERRSQDIIQKLTDKFIAETDVVFTHKEKDLMEI